MAVLNGEWSRTKGIRGAIKKLGYSICVLIGFLVDFVIQWLTKKAGFQLSTGGFFGIMVTSYLIGTEGLSITRNLFILGVPVPEFLTKAFGKLKEVGEKEAGK